MGIIDLTAPIAPHWRWPVRAELTRDFRRGDLFQSTILTLSLHAFTHLDAPLHYIPGAPSIDQIPLDQWMGDAAVVDVTHRGENAGISAADLEERAQHIRPGDIVLLRTDWPRKCSMDSREFWVRAPYTTREACEWLVARKVKSVGTDYPPDEVLRYEVLDPTRKPTGFDYPTHDVFFKAGIFVMEYLVNLHLISRPRVRVIALPLKIVGGDGSPARVIAIEDE